MLKIIPYGPVVLKFHWLLKNIRNVRVVVQSSLRTRRLYIPGDRSIEIYCRHYAIDRQQHAWSTALKRHFLHVKQKHICMQNCRYTQSWRQGGICFQGKISCYKINLENHNIYPRKCIPIHLCILANYRVYTQRDNCVWCTYWYLFRRPNQVLD